MNVENNDCHGITITVDYQEKGDTGASAYEIAVSDGFVGNESEWLASLKGDAFEFEDFTPEQIELLQEPAIEAAQVAKEAATSANTAATNANDATIGSIQATSESIAATDNSIQATEDSVEATQNANQATGDASTATSNANTATQNAIDATEGANTAADKANQAAETANSARGWQAVEEYEDYNGKEIRKIAGWQGGTGEEPTDNVGLYFSVGGGFTANKDQAVNFKGIQGNDGATIVNINPESETPSARIWIGTQNQYDDQSPLPLDAVTFILR